MISKSPDLTILATILSITFSIFEGLSENPGLNGLNNNNRECSPRKANKKVPPTPKGVESDVDAFLRSNILAGTPPFRS
ncbi:MAG: hypothetical protein R6V72_20585 [Cyclobacterium sp.]|uniref:hypothetical protein n=1 Tax=unclassified Cyclobacterium TaxID=2615055 RepID=UPI0013D7CA4C|nr:hypothetical protein [Cyclobacterium sp. SYSU L10401]